MSYMHSMKQNIKKIIFLLATYSQQSSVGRFYHSCIKLTYSKRVVWEAMLQFWLKGYNDQINKPENDLNWKAFEIILMAQEEPADPPTHGEDELINE